MCENQARIRSISQAIFPPQNYTAKILQTFGAAKHFVPSNSEGESESKSYTDIQSEYVVNLTKMKFLEVRVIAYDMMSPFIITDFLVSMTYGYKISREIILQQALTCSRTIPIYPFNR